ncbi:uncharacterized protein [Magallana gigas]|uniref:uncharacterized protein n=1 Tax=Magallana gigas TaxID=29159 RepID=UPI00333E58BC
MSPETLLNFESWGNIILNSSLYRDRVALIAIDEAHILESWGDTFRPTFARLGELRSHFPRTPFLMLTATCTQQILKHITSGIHLPGLKMFTASPDRSLSQGGRLYRDILGHLKEGAYFEQKKVQRNSHIALYHAGMATKDLEYILHAISKPDSVIRLAVCTIAFGMGINIPDIDLVIHWGACSSVMDYWQEVGRAGRDGRKAKAMYFVTPGSILHASDEMKELCSSLDKCRTKCFRDSILSYFIGYSSISQSLCKLNCIECECSQCSCCYLCQEACPCRMKAKNKN